MTRRIGLLLMLAGLGAAAPVPAMEAPFSDVVCSGEGAGQRCTVSAVQPFADNRGGLAELSVSAVRDASCTTLHIVFDEPIAVARPVTLTVEGMPPQRFYTPRQLSDLAGALDEGPQPGAVPEAGPPEFTRFLTLVAEGAIAEDDSGPEMLKRFATIKEPRRIGLTCGPMERLLPLMRSGRPVRLEFQRQANSATQVYHWPRLDRRTVDLHLGSLLEALDRAMPGS
ncbi:hypothetical protein [Roseomonas genomospecies 6]|uniref:DUF2470 domain-containing protein n=1 Tax=Roseomonas genomospecies 6 TaxID=214106 RepID=A0A9W7NNZ0_9PROT|nr:hypothetical protein [Roseomonas genomospecies 6]KAA0684123.1 hypothetical protein DS843_01410 [Roseomonas genomospecies 6]